MKKRGSTVLFWAISMALFVSPIFLINSKKTIDPIIIKENTESLELKQLGIKVHIEGAVEKSGIYTVKVGTKVFELLNQIKLKPTASTHHLNLAKTLRDGQKLVIKEVVESTLINVNLASEKELQSIPGVGKVTAGKIIQYRNTYGVFKMKSDLKNISGISEKKYQNIEGYIMI